MMELHLNMFIKNVFNFGYGDIFCKEEGYLASLVQT